MPGKPTDECGCDNNTCGGALRRREFIKIAGLGTVAGSATGMPVMAGPFEVENEYLKTIPIDKKLNPAWVASLYERGEKEVYTDPKALEHIGMPVGGIGAGLVYLGGDGRLWMWDIFNKRYPRGFMGRGAGGDTYLRPFHPIQPFAQGFALRVSGAEKTETRSLDRDGFAQVAFDGRYPMGLVTYQDPDCAIVVQLEAFSPFIPLDLENSSYPATVMRYTLKNVSNKAIEATVAGWVDNPVCIYTGRPVDTMRRNRIGRGDQATVLHCTAEEPPAGLKIETEPDIVFEDFEKSDYAGWQVVGEAFGKGPVAIKDIPAYQGDVNGVGRRVVNSHASAPGNSIQEKDRATGSLLSRPFKIDRNFIVLHIGWGPAWGTATCQGIAGG